MTSDGRIETPKRWSIKADIRIFGFTEDPQIVSHALRVSPTKTWLAGEPMFPQAPMRRWKSNGWLLSSGLPTDSTLAEHLDSLVHRLPIAEDDSIKLPPAAIAEISCGIVDYSRQVPIYFPPGIIQLASRLGASIDVSYYDVSRSHAQREE